MTNPASSAYLAALHYDTTKFGGWAFGLYFGCT